MRYDRDGDQHYDVTSAFIKSMRGSDVDAALHYLARMIEAGEDPRFIARRIMILASEDIGVADPTALPPRSPRPRRWPLIGCRRPDHPGPGGDPLRAGAEVQRGGGRPSARLSDVRAGLAGPVPAHLRDAHYGGAKPLGHGSGYLYAHD